MKQVRLVAGDPVLERLFAAALTAAGTETIRGAAPAAPLLLAPATPRERDWSGVAQELTSAFRTLQEHARANGGHVVALLPAAAAMGDPGQPALSAFAGGMLSLLRTCALEFRKANVSANSLMYELRDGQLVGGAALVAAIAALVEQDAAVITGQEVFAWSGADAGRLRP